MESFVNNRFRTDMWKIDSLLSVDYYNEWYMLSAPEAYRTARSGVIYKVKNVFQQLCFLKNISEEVLTAHPEAIGVLRSCTTPPLAVDRLAGLCHATRNTILTLESGKLPSRITPTQLRETLGSVINVIMRLIDLDLFTWIKEEKKPSSQMINRCASIVADRISGALADPIIRNSQEQRQMDMIDSYLENRGYRRVYSSEVESVKLFPPKTYAHHFNVPVRISGREVGMPIDIVIQTAQPSREKLPILVECKSAGDFANTNKRRKEEAVKVMQLRNTYGESAITFVLFLCGYFDSSYLGYEASENIDWVWEHRISDFEQFGV